MAELRVTLLGDDASLGAVPAADVARLLSGVEKVMARAAEVRQGRTGRQAGRRDAEREAATRLMLRALQPNSLTVVLDIPGGNAAGETLELDAPSLGELAAADILRTLNEGEEHPRVAEALAELAANLDIGRRRQKLEMELAAGDGRTRSHIDATTVERLRRRAEQPAVEEEATITGTMFAVNFENRTAQIRINPINVIRTVRFEERLAEQVKEALLSLTEFRGIITCDAETETIRSLELQDITPPLQLSLGMGNIDYRSSPTIEQLAAAQGVDLNANYNRTIEVADDDPEIDAFFEALGLTDITPPLQLSLGMGAIDYWSSPTIEEIAASQGIDLSTHVNRVSGIEVDDDDPEINAFFEALGL